MKPPASGRYVTVKDALKDRRRLRFRELYDPELAWESLGLLVLVAVVSAVVYWLVP